jgi:ER membrane protein complex subunit 3
LVRPQKKPWSKNGQLLYGSPGPENPELFRSLTIFFFISHLLMKARLLRENGRFLPANSFGMRKHFLADEEHGQLMKRVERQTSQPNPVQFDWENPQSLINHFNHKIQALDPSMMTEMLKGNMLNMIPMM